MSFYRDVFNTKVTFYRLTKGSTFAYMLTAVVTTITIYLIPKGESCQQGYQTLEVKQCEGVVTIAPFFLAGNISLWTDGSTPRNLGVLILSKL